MPEIFMMIYPLKKIPMRLLNDVVTTGGYLNIKDFKLKFKLKLPHYLWTRRYQKIFSGIALDSHLQTTWNIKINIIICISCALNISTL